jgi:hypothetical protein
MGLPSRSGTGHTAERTIRVDDEMLAFLVMVLFSAGRAAGNNLVTLFVHVLQT